MNARPVRAHDAQRVPDPDGAFWVVKVITTGMGETTSDFLVKSFAPELVVPTAFVALVVALIVQFRTRGYRPATYWTTALLVSVFGTMAADVLHVGLSVPYAASTAGFAVALAALFVLWRTAERTVSVHAITTTRREAFYWAAVLLTFALGTAAGDFTATALGLGYLASGILFLVAFAVPGILFLITRRAAVALFWTAYVLTRPLGASFADWFAVPQSRGGLGVGPGWVSLILFVVFLALVGRLAARHRGGSAKGRPIRAATRSAADGTAGRGRPRR